jgi:hypothetical protein
VQNAAGDAIIDLVTPSDSEISVLIPDGDTYPDPDAYAHAYADAHPDPTRSEIIQAIQASVTNLNKDIRAHLKVLDKLGKLLFEYYIKQLTSTNLNLVEKNIRVHLKISDKPGKLPCEYYIKQLTSTNFNLVEKTVSTIEPPLKELVSNLFENLFRGLKNGKHPNEGYRLWYSLQYRGTRHCTGYL